MFKNIIKQNKNGGLCREVSFGLGPKAQDSLSFYEQSEKKANEWTAPVRNKAGKGESSVFMQNFTAGFTLVEALVAISILMIAIASPMTLAQKGLSTATLSKDQMIASFLAQDAIEAVKNIRDQIAVSSNSGDWLNNTVLQPCICSDLECNPSEVFKFCTIDTTTSVWGPSSIQLGITDSSSKLKISYNVKPDGTKQFLKYDYNKDSLPSCSENPSTGGCSEDSKFTRYINIKKTSNPDEATVRVRVLWDSPQGVQNIDVKNLIYNYSENL